MRIKSDVAAVIGITAAAMLLVGCSSTAPADPAPEEPTEEATGLVLDGEEVADADLLEAALAEGSLVFYTGSSEHAETQLANAFTEQTGIEVELVRLPPNRLYERILSEQAAGQLGADVIRTSGEDLIQGIAESGAFQPVELPEEYVLPDDTRIDDGLYYRTFDCIYSFAYNNQLVSEDEAPTSWNDLLDEQWAGQLGIVQVGAGGSTAALTRWQLDALGEEYLRNYAAQDPRVFDSSGGAVDALARGEIQVGTMPISTGYAASLSGAPLTIATPEEGAVAFSYYTGVTANADSPNAAQVFLNWSLSRAGQEATGALADYPIRTDVAPPSMGEITLPAVDSGFLQRPTADEVLGNVEADADLWREIFGYTG